MNSEALKNELEAILNGCESINLYFIIRSGSKKKGWNYVCHSPQLHGDLNNEVIALLKPYVMKAFEGKGIVTFDPVAFEADTLDTLPKVDIPELGKIEIAISGLNTKITDISEISNSKTLGYCITINSAEKNISLYKHYSSSALLNNKGLPTIFGNGVLQKLSQPLYIIDNRIDALVYNENIYILSRYYFETLFSYKDEYRKKSDEALCQLQTLDLIDGFDEFREECIASDRQSKRLTKMMMDDGFNKLKENIDNVPEIINKYELRIECVDGKVIYGEDTSLDDLIKLLTNTYGSRALDNSKGEVTLFRPLQ